LYKILRKDPQVKYLSPRSDIGFKKLFGDPHHHNLTKSFLNSILNLFGNEVIETVQFAETEQLPESEDGRRSFFDVYCTDKAGKKFIIEMQSKYQAHFIVRAQYYTALAFYRQMHSPFKYEKLVPVIFVGVLDHILDETHDDVISQHALMNTKRHTISSQHQLYYSVELPKFNKILEECASDTDKWLYFMREADQFEKIPVQLQKDENFKNAFHILERARWTEQELDKYLAEADFAGLQDRIEEGALERGEKRGMEKGMRQGVLQGVQEKAQTVALESLKEGLSLSVIAKITGLSIKEIEDLQKN
jgi:predicted transposase/invertase (TIGR01784 family)